MDKIRIAGYTESDARRSIAKAKNFRETRSDLLKNAQEGTLTQVDLEIKTEVGRICGEINKAAKYLIAQGGRIPDILLDTTDFLEWAGLVFNLDGEFYTHYTPLASGNFEEPISIEGSPHAITGFLAMRSNLVRRKIANLRTEEGMPEFEQVDGVKVQDEPTRTWNDILYLTFDTKEKIPWSPNGEWLMPNYTKAELEKLARENDHNRPRKSKKAEGLVRRIERCYEAVRKMAKEKRMKEENHLALITETSLTKRGEAKDLIFNLGGGEQIEFGEFAAEKTESELSENIESQIFEARKRIIQLIDGELKEKGPGYNSALLRGGRKDLHPASNYLG